MSDSVDRKLAAILFADVVGYSRLMGADETGTLERLKTLRSDVAEPAIAVAGGTLISMAGDGIMAMFRSAVDAARCALSIQAAMAGFNRELPEEQQMQVRMGIHLGDVILEQDDIFGDGVNIAARLQTEAEPGRILVSGSVHEAVRNKVPARFEPFGERHLKNIDHPVATFRMCPADETETPAASWPRKFAVAAGIVAVGLVASAYLWLPATSWRGPGKMDVAGGEPIGSQQIASESLPVVAVLPFDNFSEEDRQDYFSDGLTEDLITDLSRLHGVRVIARNSTFSYKNQSHDVREIGQALGATHVVEGSVRRAGDKVRITVQLVTTSDGNHIWADRYDREFSGVFAIQDEVISRIVHVLSVKLTRDETERLVGRGTDNLAAYDLTLQGRWREGFFNPTDNAEAIRLYSEAIRLDPGYAEAYAHLAQVYSLSVENGWADDPQEQGRLAVETALKAISLDDDLPFAYWSLGRIYTRPYVGNNERGKVAFKKAVALNPNYADGYAFLALVEIFTGNAEPAADLIQKAMALNPRYPFWYMQALGMSYFFSGRLDEAAEILAEAVERNSNVPWVRQYYIAALGALGRGDDAEWEIAEMEAQGYEATVEAFLAVTPISDPSYREDYADALRKAGMPD